MDGSPAHAGIDPQLTRRIIELSRFPRTRGDRPMDPVLVTFGFGVPPHTRG